jgi:hypothetical protein
VSKLHQRQCNTRSVCHDSGANCNTPTSCCLKEREARACAAAAAAIDDPSLLLLLPGIVNTSLSYVGPSGAFCPGDSLAQVQAQGAACKAEVSLFSKQRLVYSDCMAQ